MTKSYLGGGHLIDSDVDKIPSLSTLMTPNGATYIKCEVAEYFAGTYRHIFPSNILSAEIHMWGGGGQAGILVADGIETNVAAAAGGGAGGYVFLALTREQILTIPAIGAYLKVGAGHANQLRTGVTGSLGFTTTFETVTASGGQGGREASSNVITASSGGLGGIGGTNSPFGSFSPTYWIRGGAGQNSTAGDNAIWAGSGGVPFRGTQNSGRVFIGLNSTIGGYNYNSSFGSGGKGSATNEGVGTYSNGSKGGKIIIVQYLSNPIGVAVQ